MIWARPLRAGAAASSLWARSGLPPELAQQLDSARETYALVTGLDEASREELADLVGAGWIGGSGDAAVVRIALNSLAPEERAGVRGALARLNEIKSTSSRTRIMGIVNVTPDSFSDGGAHFSADAAVAHGRALVQQGADLLDIGGESTRPGAQPVSEDEELRRVLPVIEGLREVGVPLSIDTFKPNVARRAVQAGASLINDIFGLRDDAMLDVVAETGARACVMHMQGTPQTMQQAPRYDDVGAEVLDALELALQRAERRGVAREKLLVDPGIGFGKTAEHNLVLLQRAADLRLLGAPVLVGVSRKGFLGALTGRAAPAERVVASAAVAAILAAEGAVDMVRVHDVAETRDALAVADAIRLARDR